MRRFARGLKFTGWLLGLCVCAGVASPTAGQGPVVAEIEVKGGAENQAAPPSRIADASNVVVWLIPLDSTVQASVATARPDQAPQLTQRNKSFQPHILVVKVGTAVRFPNRDPFFHNVFSLYNGKRFDLGLYEAGTTRTVLFDRPGVSFLFCNIHAEMSAVVIAVGTPYFGVSDRSGHLTIPDVPNGRYQMHVWYERSLPEELKGLTRPVIISESARSIGLIQVVANSNFTLTHKNKYGQDYIPPPSPGYIRP